MDLDVRRCDGAFDCACVRARKGGALAASTQVWVPIALKNQFLDREDLFTVAELLELAELWFDLVDEHLAFGAF